MALDLPQLTLDLFAAEHTDFADFIPGRNAVARDAIVRWAAGSGPWFVFLWGGAARGKTHLLQAAVRAGGTRAARTIYIPLREVAEEGGEILAGLEAVDFIAIDDLERVLGDHAFELALFDLFNRALALERRLLVTASAAPGALACTLPDLRSRLQSGLIFQLHDLDDETKATVLQTRAAARGLSLPDPVAHYLLSRGSRDLRELQAVFERIDAASLSSGRELTIPFVREVLGF